MGVMIIFGNCVVRSAPSRLQLTASAGVSRCLVN